MRSLVTFLFIQLCLCLALGKVQDELNPAMAFTDFVPEEALTRSFNDLPPGVFPIRGIDADITSNSDLIPFIPLAIRSSIFAIGESSHGVAGFQSFQFRLSKFLIEHFRYRKLLLEILSDDRALNEYLLTGVGDLAEILYLNPWQGDTQEMKDFFEWVREWNVANPRKTVTVHIVDPQAPWVNSPIIASFLAAYNPVLEAEYMPIILDNCFGAKFANQVDWAFSPETSAYYSTGTLPQDETDACFAVLDDLSIYLQDNEADIKQSLGEVVYYDAVDAVRSLDAWVLKSLLLFVDTAEALRVREDAFAQTVLWKWKRNTSGRLRSRDKAIFIAHHLHVSKDNILETQFGADVWTGMTPAGAQVHEELGFRYTAVANSGFNIQAMFMGQLPLPTSEESIDFTLETYKYPWLSVVTWMKWVKDAREGSWLVHEERVPNGRYYNLPKAFDRLVFHYNATAGVFLNGN